MWVLRIPPSQPRNREPRGRSLARWQLVAFSVPYLHRPDHRRELLPRRAPLDTPARRPVPRQPVLRGDRHHCMRARAGTNEGERCVLTVVHSGRQLWEWHMPERERVPGVSYQHGGGSRRVVGGRATGTLRTKSIDQRTALMLAAITDAEKVASKKWLREGGDVRGMTDVLFKSVCSRQANSNPRTTLSDPLCCPSLRHFPRRS